MLACSILLKKEDTINGLMYGLKHNFEEKLAKSMIEEAAAMVQSLARKYSGTGNDAAAEPEKADQEPVDSAREAMEAARGEPAKARLPFLTTRFYETLDFTLDFYESPRNPKFVDAFVNEWRRAMRDPRMTIGGASLRGSPFYFTQCPKCRIYVLTNRDVGYRISCRMCDTHWQTDPQAGRDLESILQKINGAVGIRDQPQVPMVFALWVQPSKHVSLEQIDAICKKGRFERWRNDTLLSIHLLQQAVRSGARPELPWGMWALESKPVESWAKDATPPEVAAVVRKIQRLDARARTISTELTAEQAHSMRTTAEEVESEMEESSRQAIRAGRATAADYRNLANALRHGGKLEEAERYARAAVAADEQSARTWECLGLILFKREDFAGSCEALERAVALDPGSGLALQALSICHARLGNPARARELQARANSISGGEFQG
jgi:tetratricopeptide (TPR) repeat protein